MDKNSPDYLLSIYDPTPGPKLLPKVNYFFKPYSPKIGQAKFMQFNEMPNTSIEMQINHLLAYDTSLGAQEKKEIQDYLASLQSSEQNEKASKQWAIIQKNVLGSNWQNTKRLIQKLKTIDQRMKSQEKSKARRTAVMINDVAYLRQEMVTEKQIQQGMKQHYINQYLNATKVEKKHECQHY